jgi:hypothetical protein
MVPKNGSWYRPIKEVPVPAVGNESTSIVESSTAKVSTTTTFVVLLFANDDPKLIEGF